MKKVLLYRKNCVVKLSFYIKKMKKVLLYEKNCVLKLLL